MTIIDIARPRFALATHPVARLHEALGGATLLGFRTNASAPLEEKAAFVGISAYTVTSTADDGSVGTLRYELGQEAQATAGNPNNAGFINFAPGIAGQTINLSSPLTITQPVYINGDASAPTTISGNGSFTDVVVNAGSGASVNLSNLAITNGNGTGTTGANGSTGGSNANAANGTPGGDAAGGIFVQSGNISLSRISFANDAATGGTGGQGGTYTQPSGQPGTTITSKGAGGAGGNAAGAVYVEPEATVISASTLTATNTTGQGGNGGANSVYTNIPPGPTGTGYPVSNDSTIASNTTCYVSGTVIRTLHRGVAVEDLAVGDLAVTATGALRPIKWLGHRAIDCRNHPRQHEVMPIRIAAHAFGDNRPARDLYVSPGHAICVDVLGEVLIPAGALVNGSTIQQIGVDEITYWHVELDSHDVILAENLPAESYLEMGNRGFFKEADVIDLAAGPDVDASQRTHADFCRPYVNSGPVLEAVRAQLATRAEAAGWSLTCDLDLHLEVDNVRVYPVFRDLVARFHVPAAAKDVWLVTPTARPCDTIGSADTRDLGVTITGLRIEDGLSTPREVPASDPLLCIGFHELEDGCRRWTTGRARLPAALWEGCETDFYMRVDLAGGPIPRWIAPAVEERPRLAMVA